MKRSALPLVLGAVGPGEAVAQTELAAGGRVSSGAIAGAVVGQYSLDHDPHRAKPGDRSLEDLRGGRPPLICEPRGIAEAGGVVDANVAELPAVPADALAGRR